jgi:hypothetical protein
MTLFDHSRIMSKYYSTIQLNEEAAGSRYLNFLNDLLRGTKPLLRMLNLLKVKFIFGDFCYFANFH